MRSFFVKQTPMAPAHSLWMNWSHSSGNMDTRGQIRTSRYHWGKNEGLKEGETKIERKLESAGEIVRRKER